MIIYIPSPNIARIDGVSQDTLVVFTSDESGVTVLLEQQEVHVRGCHLEGEPGGRLHSQLSGFHGFPININLRFSSRCQKFTKSRHILKRADIFGDNNMGNLLPNLLDFLLDFGLRARPITQLLNSQPKSQVFVTILFLHVLHQLLDT